MHKIGSTYQESGVYNIRKVLLFLFSSLLVCSLLGFLSGYVSSFFVMPHMRFLILLVSIFILIYVFGLFIRLAESRNLKWNYTLIIFSSIVFVYYSWQGTIVKETDVALTWYQLIFGVGFNDTFLYANFNDTSMGFDRSGVYRFLPTFWTRVLYIFEIISIVLFPLIIVKQNPLFFCEGCNTHMEREEGYYFYPKQKGLAHSLKKGDFSIVVEQLAIMDLRKHVKVNLLQVIIHKCPECDELIGSASRGVPKLGRYRVDFNITKKIVKNIYIKINK